MAEVLGDIDKGKLWIVRCLSERAPVLTEDAWEAVLSEQDEEVITWWIGLLCADSNELHFSQVRRALFESREVLRHTMSMARDAEQMKEVEAQVRLKHPEL